MPTFCHGPVRIAKADLSIRKLAATVNDTLKWKASQMAIPGAAGDFSGQSTDYSRPSDTELDEQDDILAWFSGFGFDGPGSLLLSSLTSCERERTRSFSPSHNRNRPRNRKPESPAPSSPSSGVSSENRRRH
ncbi:hypothetical protein QBC46DRAFT_437069 [Diplogelasinospora grovesii]|uniref:Uncharacterized protein n=1 Tax=Diplogelasinospora grovesii TaxID=303347 RepID=A0AAN6N736_9PEZI|nr:hypothetical protein QBC46DRAFT_437069 [Diplogelasinospora grovesii]